MTTLFSRIIAGELPGQFVHEDDRCVVFLSINPLSPGHSLVVPREELDDWLACPGDLRDHLFAVAQRTGRAIRAAYAPPRVGLVVAGFEVAHLHVHVFGAYGLQTFDFAQARTADQAELAEVAAALRAAM
ncbi:MAG TPA: HIT family protein [Acidimicrobiales bacterium]|nr:HIT family protein [Acidimicrobiales bacterium]